MAKIPPLVIFTFTEADLERAIGLVLAEVVRFQGYSPVAADLSPKPLEKRCRDAIMRQMRTRQVKS